MALAEAQGLRLQPPRAGGPAARCHRAGDLAEPTSPEGELLPRAAREEGLA